MMKNLISVVIIGLVTLLISGWCARAADEKPLLPVARFSALQPGDALPPEWGPLTFKKIKRHTLYTLVKEEGRVAVKAASSAAAAGRIHKILIDPQKYPLVEWHWKVTKLYQKGNVLEKAGNDFPARIFITFQFDPHNCGMLQRATYELARLSLGEYPPEGAISYIWDTTAPEGSTYPNPYTHRDRMIVVRSGPDRLNRWVREERNIYRDYMAAFGKEPPMISGVAILTDSDDTGEMAVSFYGDITFKAR